MIANWLEILKHEVANSTLAEVSKKIAYSKAAISQVLSGKYLGSTDRIAKKVTQVYSQVECPFKGEVIVMSVCRDTALGRAPMHNPAKMSQWKHCQKCPKRPKE